MDYAICDSESLKVWVEVSALYKRSFLVAQGDPISIGPGTVFLTASLTEAGHYALLHEEGSEEGEEDQGDGEKREDEDNDESHGTYDSEEDAGAPLTK